MDDRGTASAPFSVIWTQKPGQRGIGEAGPAAQACPQGTQRLETKGGPGAEAEAGTCKALGAEAGSLPWPWAKPPCFQALLCVGRGWGMPEGSELHQSRWTLA